MKHMHVIILAAAALSLSACGSIEQQAGSGSEKVELVDGELSTGSRLPPKKIKEAPVNMAGQPISSGQPKN